MKEQQEGIQEIGESIDAKEVRQDDENDTQFSNRAELVVYACGEHHTIYSNEVCLEKIIIRIEKYQDKQCVFPGSYLDYTIRIFNESSIDIANAVFADEIPEGMSFVPNTFTVDGTTYSVEPFANRITYTLSVIPAHSEVVVAFRTLVQ